jgi:hypothetical protein
MPPPHPWGLAGAATLLQRERDVRGELARPVGGRPVVGGQHLAHHGPQPARPYPADFVGGHRRLERLRAAAHHRILAPAPRQEGAGERRAQLTPAAAVVHAQGS